MLERAIISRGYLIRLGLVAFCCIGLAMWCVYDAQVTYPNQRVRALKFEELEKKYEDLKEEDFLAEWEAVTTENGWPLENPGEPKDKWDIINQYVMVGMVTPVGLVFLFLLIRAWGRWIEADDEGLRTSWGQLLQYDQIVTLDKKQWKAKGIARIRYDVDGRTKKLVLDDCKYDFEPTELILRKVESEIELDRIVGGPPQPPPEEEQPADDEQLSAENDERTDEEAVREET